MAAPTAASTEALSSSTSTKAALVKEVIRRLEDDPITDVETAGVNSSATTFATGLTAANSYENGDTLDFLDDGTFEAVLITTAGSGSHTVRRGHRQTTAAAHSANAVFRKNPRHLSHIIGEYVDACVQDLWPDLYTVYAATYTSATDIWYALPAACEEVFEVYQYTGTPADKTTGPIVWAGPTFAHSAEFSTKKGLKVRNIDTSLTSFFVIYSQRAAVTELTTAMSKIVVLDAARMALGAEVAHRPSRQTEAFIFDASTKMDLFRREASRLRDREAQRLQEFMPERDRLLYVQRKHYSEGVSGQVAKII